MRFSSRYSTSRRSFLVGGSLLVGGGAVEGDVIPLGCNSQARILGISYASDWRCPNKRFNRLTQRFKDRFFRLDLAGSHKHSTLGEDFSCLGFAEVAAFLRQRLVDPSQAFPLRSVANSINPKPISEDGCLAASPDHLHS